MIKRLHTTDSGNTKWYLLPILLIQYMVSFLVAVLIKLFGRKHLPHTEAPYVEIEEDGVLKQIIEKMEPKDQLPQVPHITSSN